MWRGEFLLATWKGIYSICRKCGLAEWEWGWEDNPKYIDYLAERFEVERGEIIQALELAVGRKVHEIIKAKLLDRLIGEG